KRHFVVQAGDRRVVATGTSFDVRLDRDAIAVTLLEGHVIVAPNASTSGSTQSAIAELQPGEKLVAKLGGAMTINLVDPSNATDWTKGKHIFRDETLSDAVAEVNRYTDQGLELSDPGLGDIHVSGVFRTGHPEEFARGLAAIDAVNYSVDASGRIH